MGRIMKLKVGLVSEGVYAKVLEEMLDHQGVIYERISIDTDALIKFPCILLADSKDKTRELALEHCLDEDNIVCAEEMPIEDVLLHLSGFSDRGYLNDQLMNCAVNKAELDLLNKIREIYYREDLPLVRKWYWPEFMRTCGIVTHDIDTLRLDNKTLLGKFEYRIKHSLLRLSNVNCQHISDIIIKEKEKGFKSSFYFFSRYEYKKYKSKLATVFKTLNKYKFEIGVHGSMFSFQDPRSLKKEILELQENANTTVRGVRQHALNFIVPHTWRYQEEAGLDYDLSFFYNDEFGFRAGLCFPYHPFDILTKKKFNILEIPTSFMDWTGIDKNMDYGEFYKVVKELAQTIEKYNGCFVLNFHNLYIDKKNYPSIERLFREMLDYLNKRDYWVTTARECADWWRRRENAKIDMELKGNKVVGRTDTPLPLIIEREGERAMYVNVKDEFIIKTHGGK